MDGRVLPRAGKRERGPKRRFLARGPEARQPTEDLSGSGFCLSAHCCRTDRGALRRGRDRTAPQGADGRGAGRGDGLARGLGRLASRLQSNLEHDAGNATGPRSDRGPRHSAQGHCHDERVRGRGTFQRSRGANGRGDRAEARARNLHPTQEGICGGRYKGTGTSGSPRLVEHCPLHGRQGRGRLTERGDDEHPYTVRHKGWSSRRGSVCHGKLLPRPTPSSRGGGRLDRTGAVRRRGLTGR